GQWQSLRHALACDAQIGAQVGVAIPSLGIGCGLLTGALIHVGLAALIARNEKGYREYSRVLKDSSVPFDFEREEAIFGCTSEQVAVFALAKMGFGIDMGQAFTVAFDQKREVRTITERLPLQMRLSRLWI